MSITSLPERVQKKILVDEGTGCWVWQAGCARATGYGRLWHDGDTRSAHRVVYEMINGPILDGLQLDHLCRNRPCVNPDHLEPVTGRINTLRGNTVTANNAAKTHCPQGHEYTADNTYHRPDMVHARACRVCLRGASRKYRARKRADK